VNKLQAKLDEWASYGLEDSPELAHITDRRLKLLYAAILWDPEDPEGVLAMGELLLPRASDELAILEAMRCAARALVEDVAEHGPTHGDARQFAAQLKKISGRIKKAEARGSASQVFAVWEKRRREALE
jgi:hypothetical protein